jgi:hypothetical protein
MSRHGLKRKGAEMRPSRRRSIIRVVSDVDWLCGEPGGMRVAFVAELPGQDSV